MGLLDGKTAIVTGAARGIGKAIALKFASEGANIAFTDLVIDENAENTAKEIEAMGVKAKGYASNAANFEDTAKVVEAIHADFGRIDILVNNAGYLPIGSVETTSLDEIQRSFGVLVYGMFLGMQTVIPEMKKTKELCAILNVSSVCGAYVATENNFAYNAAKSAVVGMTRAAAVDLAGSTIRVNVIHPGTIDGTAISGNVLQGKMKKIKLSKIPLGRAGTPEEVAAVASFLCSDEASYIHGASLVVDGGQILGYRDPASFS